MEQDFLNNSFVSNNKISQKKILLIASSIAIIIITGLFIWYYLQSQKSKEEETNLPNNETSQDLGSQLFEEVNNPVRGAIPSTNPVVNPVEDIYKNPFE